MPIPHETVDLDEVRLIGATLRTSNARGAEIGAFWGRLFSEGHFERIPNKASDDIYGVYTDYESDHLGEYTLFVGSPVTSVDDVPEGMSTLTIAPGRYARFVLPDATPTSIVAVWTQIWDSALEPRRAYVADFDRTYRADDGEMRAETYLGLRR
jgi:predicted transcriptional regulator YdeE